MSRKKRNPLAWIYGKSYAAEEGSLSKTVDAIHEDISDAELLDTYSEAVVPTNTHVVSQAKQIMAILTELV